MRAICLALCMVSALTEPGRAQDHTQRFSIVVPQLPDGGRLMAFDITIKGGQVSTLRTVPAGWVITINNDPSWNGSVTGQAVVGAAALEVSDLAKILTVSPPPTLVQGEPMSLSGSITVTLNGDDTKRTFPSIQVRPAPASP